MSFERRRVRDEEAAARTMELTFPTRVAVYLDRSPSVSLIGDLSITVLEVTAVILYFVGFGALPCSLDANSASALTPAPPLAPLAFPVPSTSPPDRHSAVTLISFPLPSHFTVANGILGVVFAVHFSGLLYLSPNRSSLLKSHYTVTTVLTVVPMIVALLLHLFDPSMHTFWVPSFLRVWWAHRHVGTLLTKHFHRMHPAVKEITVLAILVMSLIVSCVAFVQFFESWGNAARSCPSTLVTSFYLVMVTITTIGYGDVAPTTYAGRTTIALVIFVAMFLLPSVLGKLQDLAAFVQSQNTYSQPTPHVIVCGDFSLIDVKVIVQEFLLADSRASSRHVVIVTERPLDERIVRWLQRPSLRNRITICVSDVQRKGQILRFRARSAEAVFLVSPRGSIAQRGDYETMMKSVVFYRYEPTVPQCLLLKRGMHSRAMRRTANLIFEREQLKFYLMGVALRLPLFIPFMVNLLKSSRFLGDFDGDETDGSAENDDRAAVQQKHRNGRRGSLPSAPPGDNSWWGLYLRGASCDIFAVPLPPTLHGRLFSSAASIIHTKLSYTVIGIERRISDGTADATAQVMLTPMKLKLQLTDRLVVIAPNSLNPNEFVAEFMKSHHTSNAWPPTQATSEVEHSPSLEGFAFGGGEPDARKATGSRDDDQPKHKHASRRSASAHHPTYTGLHPTSSFAQHSTHSFSSPGVPLKQSTFGGTRCAPPLPKSSSAAASVSYPFDNHVLLIDLSNPNAELESMNNEELIECRHFQALDLLRLLRTVIHHGLENVEQVPVVYLSGQTLSDAFASAWPPACRPVYHMRGYGTELSHLKRAGVATARVVVLFFSVECERQDSTTNLVASVVHELLVAAGREKVVPVIYEVEDLSLAHLLPPKMFAMSSEDLIQHARDSYTCSPSFFTGKLISSNMVDAVVYRCLDTTLPSIVFALLGIPEEGDSGLLERMQAHSTLQDKSLQSGKQRSTDHGGVLYDKLFNAEPVYLPSPFGTRECVFMDTVEHFIPPEAYQRSVNDMQYGEVFHYAIAAGCVPCGLQRLIDNDDHGPHLVGASYFATCPPNHIYLKSTDLIYYIKA